MPTDDSTVVRCVNAPADANPVHVHRWASNETYTAIPYMVDRCLVCHVRRIEVSDGR